jgi:hypothetical protein
MAGKNSFPNWLKWPAGVLVAALGYSVLSSMQPAKHSPTRSEAPGRVVAPAPLPQGNGTVAPTPAYRGRIDFNGLETATEGRYTLINPRGDIGTVALGGGVEIVLPIAGCNDLTANGDDLKRYPKGAAQLNAPRPEAAGDLDEFSEMDLTVGTDHTVTVTGGSEHINGFWTGGTACLDSDRHKVGIGF